MNAKRIFAALLALWLTLSLAPAALAAPAKETKTEEAAPEIVERKISTAAEFAAFSRACARESYSSGVRFVLTADLDLTGTDFESVPYFAGEFDGGGHSVSGLRVERAGSRLGLFREIAQGASVHDLTVSGRVVPTGTREYIGGLVGVNAGTVKNCAFSGEVRGLNGIGGLVGLNSGSVTGCAFDGTVCGEHQVGGIAGSNAGVLFNCESEGQINAEEITPSGERRFDLASFSQDDFVDLSDIGGVAGENTGVLRFCRGKGAVGYHYTGYNVGGVAGKNSGLVDNCRSECAVEGRRDVGGVVGQSIPYAAWNLSEGKLEELQKAIRTLNYQLGSLSRKTGELSGVVKERLTSMNTFSSAAMSAISQLLSASAGQTARYLAGITVDPVTGEITLPNAGFGVTDTSVLTAALNNLFSQSGALTEALKSTVGGTAEDLQSITSQMSYVFNLVNGLMNELGAGDLISARDLSLDEAYEHDEGAVSRCENRGTVRAEQNAGGVVGCVAFELAFDMEDSLGSSNYLPTHAERLIFAIVRGCRSDGAVSSRGDCAGGVVGRLDLGAVVDCVATGAVSSQNGSYVGGVVGAAGGPLARCWARCELEGLRYVGGVAGLGEDVKDCRALSHIARAEEYAGALAGWCEGTVSGNYYALGTPEGVDGVSRISQAEPLTRSELLALEDAPEKFENITVRFYAEGELIRTLSVPFGGAVERLPAVENRGGAAWVWDAFDASALYCDTDVTGAYLEPRKTIASGEDFPLFLVEGEFWADQELKVQPFDGAPEEGERLGGYTLSVEGAEGLLTVRMRSESGAAVYAPQPDGTWRELESEWDGRYLVFGLPNGGSFAVMAQPERPDTLILAAAGGAGLLALALVGRALARRKKKKAAENTEAAQQNS